MPHRFTKVLKEFSDTSSKEMTDALLELVPALERKVKVLDGQSTEKWLRGYDSADKHTVWVADLLQRLQKSGLSEKRAILELRDLMSALHRIPNLNGHHAVDALEHLRKGPRAHLDALRKLAGEVGRAPGNRHDAITTIQWLLYRQFGDGLGAARLDFSQVIKHVPGFDPADPAAIRAFRKAFDDIAKRPARTTESGRDFEKLYQKFQNDRFPQLYDLNTIQTNFPIYDVIVREKSSGATRFASLADGGFAYLSKKFDAVVTPKPELIAEVVAKVDSEVVARGTAGVAMLAGKTPAQARQIIAQRSVLLVHPKSVDAARAVIASRPDFKNGTLLKAWRKSTGNPNGTAEDLLAVIQPAFQL